MNLIGWIEWPAFAIGFAIGIFIFWCLRWWWFQIQAEAVIIEAEEIKNGE